MNVPLCGVKVRSMAFDPDIASVPFRRPDQPMASTREDEAFDDEPIVITGVGLVASAGMDRESVWRAVRDGRSCVRRLSGLRGLPDGKILGATVDMPVEHPHRLKVLPMAEMAANEAVRDARLDLNAVDPDRFGCSISSHMGDASWLEEQAGLKVPNDPDRTPWWLQFLPNSTCAYIANQLGAMGPRYSYSTACASSLISFMSAVRALRDGQCDVAIAGGADAIDPLFVAGFQKMRVLAEHEDPNQACRPFDRNRCGFVIGEGAAMLVLERLSHAQQRAARIYAQVLACRALAEAHHVTGLDADSEALSYLISSTLRSSKLRPRDVGYVNAHGTGTQQNDLVEMRSIREAFGPAADQLCVSSTKSTLGHMINAAGGTELAITVLAMRDGFAPPTKNLTDPDPELSFDCLPMVGRRNRFQSALKLSVAFGGHLVAVALSRWNDAASGFAYPPEAKVA
jgi:3-oxoacyl-(acyl-carrier-protein) synthase